MTMKPMGLLMIKYLWDYWAWLKDLLEDLSEKIARSSWYVSDCVWIISDYHKNKLEKLQICCKLRDLEAMGLTWEDFSLRK